MSVAADAHVERGFKASSWQLFRSADMTQDATCLASDLQSVVSVNDQGPGNTRRFVNGKSEIGASIHSSSPSRSCHVIYVTMTRCFFW